MSTPGSAMTPPNGAKTQPLERGRHVAPLARRQLLVARRRPAHVGPLRRRHRPRGARRARRARPRRDALLLLLARLRPPARDDRRGRRRAVRRLPRRARGGRDAHDPDVPRRPHVRRELGPGVAAGTRPPPRRLDGLPAGLVRRRDRAALRRPSRGLRLARLERDAAVRRARLGRGDHRLGADRRSGRPVDRVAPPDLARRRRLGHRGDGRGQRVLAPQARTARRLHRAALVPDAGRRAAPAALPRVRMRAGGRLREARRPRGVRRHVRLRVRRERRRVLPAGAAHDPARRRPRLARVEQLRLRRPARRGPVPPPRLRAPLRPDGLDRAAEVDPRGDERVLVPRPRAAGGLGAASGAARRSSSPSTSSASSPSPTRPIAGTSATSSCRRTSPPARRTSPSASSASWTGSRPTRSCSSPRAPSC